jgi:hypothetical protein
VAAGPIDNMAKIDEFRRQLIASAIQGSAVNEGAVPEDIARRAIDIAEAVVALRATRRAAKTPKSRPTSGRDPKGRGDMFDED